MKRNCNLELCLFPSSDSLSSNDPGHDNHNQPMMEEGRGSSQEKQQQQQQQQQLTIFYNGKICVYDVTEFQVAEAMFEITLTRFSGDILPATDAGIVLSIADRLASLVGLFASGCQPSSTNDPFGLRRISYGLVQVLVEKDRNLDLKQALELVAEVQHIKVDASTIDDVHQFVTRRLEQFLVERE